LFDEQKVELVQLRKMFRITHVIRRIRIHLQRQLVAERATHRPHGLDIEAWFDLQLDAQVSVVEILLHDAQQVVD